MHISDQFRHGFSLGEVPGVAFSNSNTWTEVRRTSLQILRDFGYGKNVMEDIIEEEIDNLTHHIDNNWLNMPLDVARFFNITSVASLWRITSGESLKIGDPKLDELMICLQRFFIEFGNPMISIFLYSSVMCRLIHFFKLTTIADTIGEMFEYCNEYINLNKKRPIDGETPLTFIEAFLHKINETKSPSDPLYGDRGILNLQNTLLDFFMAGSDTTSTSMNWAMLYMILHPDVQEKVRKELEANVGSKKVKMSDKNSTPYTEAVIHEVLRKSSIAPVSLFHISSDAMKVGQYDIPKDTLIVPMLYDIHHNPEYFNEPDEFKPERFLSKSEDGSLKFTPDPKVIPFGTGKRRCLGENLARMSLYKVFTSLIQKYEIVSGQDDQVEEKHQGGILLNPQPYKLRFIKIN